MVKVRAGIIIRALIVGVFVMAPVAVLAAEELAPPPGYQTEEEVRTAIFTGKAPLISLVVMVPDSVEVIENIEYKKVDDVSLQLDLYRPAALAAPAPGIVLIHGGGWEGGHRYDMRPYAAHFAELGYVVASVSYRLTDVAPFPAQVQDVKCAVRWMRANAEKYGIDPATIVAMGNSAGGHLSLMLGLTGGEAELDDPGCYPEEDSRVQAAINFYGPSDLTTEFAQAAKVVKKLFGGKSFEEAPEAYKLASPLFHIDANDPPLITLHGTIDSIVPIEQADRLDAKMKEAGVPHEYVRLEGWPHTMDLAQPVHDYCLSRIEPFLAKYAPLKK